MIVFHLQRSLLIGPQQQSMAPERRSEGMHTQDCAKDAPYSEIAAIYCESTITESPSELVYEHG